MTNALRHRGPDTGGVESLDGAVLGHRRLRIIDLRPQADQPATDERQRFWLLFNGEIYNFRELRAGLEAAGHSFLSDSDTEVIVHLVEERGADFPRYLRGMFAIALWDTAEQTLLLVRDRLGIKPLYYQRSGSRLFFSSEARALPGARQGLDEYALASFLYLGWVPGPRTAYRDVLELPPGHCLRWHAGEMSVDRWWWPTETPPPVGGKEFREVLVDAMRRHLVADVPLGIFLSGGLDSAAIATLSAEFTPDVTAYTVAFREGPDETKAARDLAARLGLRHDVVPISGGDVVASIEDFLAAMDQPTVDGLNSWVISRGVRESGAVAALSGVGGDELFAGYSTYRHVPRITSLLRPSALMPELLRVAPSALLGLSSFSAHSRARRVLDSARHPGPEGVYAAVRGPMCVSEVEQLRGGWGRDLRRRPPIVSGPGRETVHALEMDHYLPNQLLRDTDVMSMAHSLEVRVPLLDDEVVAAAAGYVSARGQPGKQELALSVDPQLLPIATAPKQTFTLPVDEWLRGSLHDWAGDMLHGLAAAGMGFDRRQLFVFFQDFQDGRAGWRPLWSLCVLGGWLSRNESGRPATAGTAR